MENLNIKNFKARYHLPTSRLMLRDRLDRLLDEVLDDALELFLEHMGLSARDEICIRQIHIPVRLAMSPPDRSVVMNWSRAIAEHIQQTIQHSDPQNVIRYSSRQHGLVDFAIGVATGNYHRAWAWHQLGFIREARIGTDESAAVALATALENEAEWIIPVLKSVAQTGKFYQLVNRIPHQAWIDLAMSALAAHGVVLEPHAVAEAPDSNATSDDPALSAMVSRIVFHSAFATILGKDPKLFTASRISPRVVAVFAIIDTEPALLRRSYHETQSLVQHTALALQAIVTATEPAISFRQTPSSQTDIPDRDRKAIRLPKASDENPAANGRSTALYSDVNSRGYSPVPLDYIDSSERLRQESEKKPISGQDDGSLQQSAPRTQDPSRSCCISSQGTG